MILYNVTVHIDEDIHQEWVTWMGEKHIQDVLDTGLFKGHRMYKILSNPVSEGPAYVVQYFLESMEDFEKYQKEHAPALQKEHMDKFEGKFGAFRTIMEEV